MTNGEWPKPDPKQPSLRVYFTGADGSGKTTLVDYVHREYNIPMVNEVARSVLAEWRKTFAEIRASGASASEYQTAVFRRQFEEESKLASPYVSDRSLDNLAYAAEHGTNFKALHDSIPASYIEHLQASIVFIVRPQRSFRQAASADPFRMLSEWEAQCRIDAHTEMLFKLHSVPFVVIAEPSAAAREALVDWCLAAKGFSKRAHGLRP